MQQHCEKPPSGALNQLPLNPDFAEGTAYTSSASGFVGASGPAGTVPVTTTTPAGTSGAWAAWFAVPS